MLAGGGLAAPAGCGCGSGGVVGCCSVGRTVDAVDRAGAALSAGAAQPAAVPCPRPACCAPLSVRAGGARRRPFRSLRRHRAADRRAGQCARSGRLLRDRAARAGTRGHFPRRSRAGDEGGGVRRRCAGGRDAGGVRGASAAVAERGRACGVRRADRRRAGDRGGFPRRRGRARRPLRLPATTRQACRPACWSGSMRRR